jgi:hypothetical protein
MGVTGGHCILPNLDFISSPFAKFIKDQNEWTENSNNGNKQ